MPNLGRRRGDGVTYQRGQGTVEQELEKVQSTLELLDPRVCDLEAEVKELRTDRDTAKGMLRVIIVLQGFVIMLIVAFFGWGLNHVTFHSDWERPGHSESVPLNATQSGDLQQSKEVQAPIQNER